MLAMPRPTPAGSRPPGCCPKACFWDCGRRRFANSPAADPAPSSGGFHQLEPAGDDSIVGGCHAESWRLQRHDLDLEPDRDVVVDGAERPRQPEAHLIHTGIEMERGQPQ